MQSDGGLFNESSLSVTGTEEIPLAVDLSLFLLQLSSHGQRVSLGVILE